MRKVTQILKTIAIATISIFLTSYVKAQDSITVDNNHEINYKSFIIPTAILGVSAIFTSDGWFAEAREDVQDVLSNKGHNKIKADEFLRFAPSVAISALNLTKIKSKHNPTEKLKIRLISTLTMVSLTQGMKYAFNETRPDGSNNASFPSGHTATTFMGAEFLYHEYRDSAPWIGYTGYAMAALTGYLRIYNNKHWINDVVAGACIGVVSTKFAYWVYPKIFSKAKCEDSPQVFGLPYYDGTQGGFCLSMIF